MVLSHGIEVEVICNDQTLPIYDDPDWADTETPYSRQNYVEAITGATFVVKVTLTETFGLGGCDGVKALLGFDGNKETRHFHLMRHGSSYRFTGFEQYDPQARQWRKDEFGFRNLATNKIGQEESRYDTGLTCCGTQMKRLVQILLHMLSGLLVAFSSSLPGFD